jgi:DNA-binding FadR family transcriptional regulator
VFKPVARRVVAAEVFEQLRNSIVRGDIASGSSLPAERALASMLRVNRNAVREGLKRLEQAGLVAIQQGGATRVLDFRRTAGLEALAGMLVRANGTVDTRVVRSIVEMRTAMAPIIARLAAERASRQQVERMEAVVAKMREAGDDLAALARLALDYWAEVVSATANIALELAFNSLATSYGSVIDQLQHVMADELRALADYEALAGAIAAREPDRAARRASRITSRGHEAVSRVVEMLEVAQRPQGR